MEQCRVRIGSYSMINNKTEIIVAEDNSHIRASAMEVLLQHGLTPYEAENADEALFVIAAHPNAAILFTDIEMPGGMNGIELAARAHDARPGMGIIVTSGHYCGDRQMQMPEYATFLAKPYQSRQLLDAVDGKIADSKQVRILEEEWGQFPPISKTLPPIDILKRNQWRAGQLH